MPIDISKVRNWSRKGHTEDDPALGMAWEAAKEELEKRTGWCVDPVTRYQYVPEAPDNDQRLVLIDRQPATSVTFTIGIDTTILSLVTINGRTYAKMTSNAVYPLTLTVGAGSNTLSPMLEMALLQRTLQIEAARGDDTVTLSTDYWDRICAMMGKGIA